MALRPIQVNEPNQEEKKLVDELEPKIDRKLKELEPNENGAYRIDILRRLDLNPVHVTPSILVEIQRRYEGWNVAIDRCGDPTKTKDKRHPYEYLVFTPKKQ